MAKRELSIEDLVQLEKTKERIRNLHDKLKGEDRFLHAGQLAICKEIFQNGKTDITLQCGRNWGKSTLLLYVAWRLCSLIPGFRAYIIAPERVQANEIYWASSILQDFGPRDSLLPGDDAFSKSELRINFCNGSFIKLGGADNVSALRGFKPDFIGCDEFQDWSQDAWTAIHPNVLARKALVIKIGTPPDKECFYIKHRAGVFDEIKRGNKRFFYKEAPTSDNPIIPIDWLAELEAGFKSRGEYAIFRREYLAEYVPGGAGAVFPMFRRREHIRDHRAVMSIIERDANQLKWYVICDPGTTSAFGVLFAAHNPYTAELYILDEIYERDRMNTSTVLIWNRVKRIRQELYPTGEGKWRGYYDEAAAWFQREVQYHFGENLYKTEKFAKTKQSNVSLFKDILNLGRVIVSNRCENFVWELENYVTDKNGELQDENDHLIDCCMYLLSACHFKFLEGRKERYGITSDSPRRGVTRIEKTDDWTEDLGDGYFDA